MKLNLLKRLAALCLFISFFLPLSQCSVQKDPTQTPSTQEILTASPSVDVRYAYNADHDTMMFRAVNVFAFTWPLMLTLVLLVYAKFEHILSVQITAIALCLASAFCLLRLTSFGELLIGGYLAWGSLITYFLVSLTQFLQRVRQVWSLAEN
ncbi:hypothetical protein H8K33_17225 [Undibacterium amnicola]|uniref:Uncharacterized protein n=1 Tax=Undibacterium amnicola TaxID=1834038 RepID=A0ABR6XUV5_9BURK|nr:hypothetical protein [Undibacterium amnicola]MBC3833255.1 hypothetical protein [Undibacterium amnicola]